MSFSPSLPVPDTDSLYASVSPAQGTTFIQATATVPQARKLTWRDFIAEAKLMEPMYQKFELTPLSTGSARLMPIQKLHFSNITHGVKRVNRIGTEDIKAHMEEYFAKLEEREGGDEKPEYLSEAELNSLNSHVREEVLALAGDNESTIPKSPRMLNVTDDISFVQNVRQDVLEMAMELVVHVKGDGFKERHFYVHPNDVQKMAPILCTVLQSTRSADATARKNSATMAAFIIPPWYLGEQELKAFVECSKVERFEKLWPELATVGTKRVLARDISVDEKTLPHALWTLISERCMADYIDYFVLTTYEHWVFGCIGKDKRTGYATLPLTRHSEEPKVLEMLMLWLLSSMSGPLGWSPSELELDDKGKRRQCSTESFIASANSDHASAVSFKKPHVAFPSSSKDIISERATSFVENWQAELGGSSGIPLTPCRFFEQNSTPIPNTPEVRLTPSNAFQSPGHYGNAAVGSRSPTAFTEDSAYSGSSLYLENGEPLFDITHFARYAEDPSEVNSQAYLGGEYTYEGLSNSNTYYATASQVPTPQPAQFPLPIYAGPTTHQEQLGHSNIVFNPTQRWSYNQQALSRYYWQQPNEDSFARMDQSHLQSNGMLP
ncbi:hypothetical protein BDY19DRAFT_997227 [Irpex rosettiformis]|uniref:Uncharacterized protein n=1 Tax=Irpex rosettiformis TaxID=378272 RepID=A0ACB8TSN3_9APHY|nr:hypothetical protein BDY19DRAFT_997227 [Irpex rosettiformis]